jgi:hypothetical protein
MLDKVASVFGCVDINFPQDAAFSRAYRLHGKDPAAVSAVFNEGVRGFLVRNAQLYVERAAPGLVIYRSGVRLEPRPEGFFGPLPRIVLFAGGLASRKGKRYEDAEGFKIRLASMRDCGSAFPGEIWMDAGRIFEKTSLV